MFIKDGLLVCWHNSFSNYVALPSLYIKKKTIEYWQFYVIWPNPETQNLHNHSSHTDDIDKFFFWTALIFEVKVLLLHEWIILFLYFLSTI